MGTRNITSVIMDGKQVVCQYGQWDGYPSWTGTKLLEFLRDADPEKLKQSLANTTIKVTDYENAVSYTGSTKDYSQFSEIVTTAKRELSDLNGQWPDNNDVFQYLLEQGKYTEDDLENYFVWTRDTGCDVLPLIYHRSLEKSPLELAAMTHEYQGEYSWDIQGVYVINLDDRSIHMTFDGCPCEFDMDHLPEDIELTMMVYELAAYKLYEFKSQDFSDLFSSKEKTQVQEQMQNIAKDMVSQIIKEIKTEDPDLISDSKDIASAEAFGREYLSKHLLERAGAQKNLLAAIIKSAEEQSLTSPVGSTEKGPEL